MPADIPGLGATSRLSPSLPIGSAVPPGAMPTGPVGPVTPSTALAPVAPVGTRQSSTPRSTLGRSGLDLLDVLGTTDLLLERQTVAPVALDVGLETARGALLRGLAAESLATLDGVWERAQLTEEGWYLRSGALTVLGLPGEAERVSTAALERKPSSVALRFMQSLARLASGDVPGARDAIAAALERRSMHPVLLMQQSIVLARQGHGGEAERLLQQILRLCPDHPAAAFARSTLRSIAADRTRSTSRSAFGYRAQEPATFTSGDYAAFDAFRATKRDVPRDPTLDAMCGSGHGTVESAAAESTTIGTDPAVPAEDVGGNVAARALARLGARFVRLSAPEVVHEGRMLIRAFSAGGSLSGACVPEQAHAARAVLTAIVYALHSGASLVRPSDGASSLEALLAQWLPLMRAERFDDAARVLRRFGTTIPAAQRQLLAAFAQLPLETSAQGDRVLRTKPFGTGEYEALVLGEAAQGPIVPVRFGLGLLEERESQRSAEQARERTANGWIDRPRAVAPRHATPGHMVPSRVTPFGVVTASVESDGRGWGAAMVASAYLPPPRDEGAAARIAALLCVIIAAGAAMSGAGVLTIAFGIGAAWLGLRRNGRLGERANVTGDRDASGAD